MKSYHIKRATLAYDPVNPSPDFWQQAEIAPVDNFPWYQSGEKWDAFAQLLYDEEHLYFRMVSRNDHHIRGRYTELDQPVYKDSTGECFVQPGAEPSVGYFNYEINCVGTMLLAHGYQRGGRQFVRPELARQVRIWHSIPGPTKEESPEDCCWEIQAMIPYAVMRASVEFPTPGPGSEWRGNLYRCADDTSNPQYSMWNPIELPQPDYHRPEFFGRWLFD